VNNYKFAGDHLFHTEWEENFPISFNMTSNGVNSFPWEEIGGAISGSFPLAIFFRSCDAFPTIVIIEVNAGTAFAVDLKSNSNESKPY
jgi:hypothetical protein